MTTHGITCLPNRPTEQLAIREKLMRRKIPTTLCAQMFRTISNHLTDGEDRSDPLIQTIGLTLLQLTLESLQKKGRAVELSCPPYANDILTYLQSHTEEKVSMEDVAREFHLSQAHIFRVFRQTYHISPINYLIYCKMRQARVPILNCNSAPARPSYASL